MDNRRCVQVMHILYLISFYSVIKDKPNESFLVTIGNVCFLLLPTTSVLQLVRILFIRRRTESDCIYHFMIDFLIYLQLFRILFCKAEEWWDTFLVTIGNVCFLLLLPTTSVLSNFYRAFRLLVRSSFVFCKQQLLLAMINHVIYFSQ